MGRRIASDAQVAMQHRYRCDPDALTRVDALPPWDTDLAAHRFICGDCDLYLTGPQLRDEEIEDL